MRGADSKIKLVGNVSLYELPPYFTYEDFKNLKDREKYLKEKGFNLVVDVGLAQIISLMIGSSTTSWTYCEVGSGTNTPTAGDTTLQTALGRNAINDRYRVGLSGYFDTFFGKNDAAGTWAETGLFTASSGGIMLCRKKFDSTFVKNTTNSSVVSWNITYVAVAD